MGKFTERVELNAEPVCSVNQLVDHELKIPFTIMMLGAVTHTQLAELMLAVKLSVLSRLSSRRA